MKIHCIYTPRHEELFRRHFAATLPAGLELHAEIMDISGPGDFLSPEFLACIRHKVDRILDSIRSAPGRVIIWSDVDIRFYSPEKEGLAALMEECLGGADIAFQREGRRVPFVNTGFFAVRCGPAAEDFFGRVKALMEAEPGWNEQAAVNELLFGAGRKEPVAWAYLPWGFYARTHGLPPPAGMILHHANYTAGSDGVGQKLVQLEWMREYVASGPVRRACLLASVLVRRNPAALLRSLAGRFHRA